MARGRKKKAAAARVPRQRPAPPMPPTPPRPRPRQRPLNGGASSTRSATSANDDAHEPRATPQNASAPSLSAEVGCSWWRSSEWGKVGRLTTFLFSRRQQPSTAIKRRRRRHDNDYRAFELHRSRRHRCHSRRHRRKRRRRAQSQCATRAQFLTTTAATWRAQARLAAAPTRHR